MLLQIFSLEMFELVFCSRLFCYPFQPSFQNTIKFFSFYFQADLRRATFITIICSFFLNTIFSFTLKRICYCLFGWLVGFLKSSSTTRLYRGRAPRQSVWQFYVLPHIRQSWNEFCLMLSRLQYTDNDPTSMERPQRESTVGPPHQVSRALPTELPPRFGLTIKRLKDKLASCRPGL